MYVRKCSFQSLLLFLTVPNLAISGPISSPEIFAKPNNNNNNNNNNNIAIQQQKLNNTPQDAQLNTLNAYASNYDAISNKQNENDNFKPSYKLPDIETNFTPIYNSNSIAPASLGSQAPVLMQYLPQTINENGVQYLQLIPTRPLMVPIAPYLTGNTGVQSLTYHQHLAPGNSIDYTTRPLLSTLPINIPPPARSPLIDVPSMPLPPYGIQTYADNISNYKQNHRINRETKDKQLLGPINLNLQEYLPSSSSHRNIAFHFQGRP